MTRRLLATVTVAAVSAMSMTACSRSDDAAAPPSPSPSVSAPVADLSTYGSVDEAVLAAVRSSDVDLLRAALEAGGDPDVLDEPTQYPALAFAALRNDPDSAQLLIDYGASLYDEESGYLPLAVATGGPVAQVLVEAGSPVDGFGDIYGAPVMNAAYEGYADVLVVLLEAGANPNVEWRSDVSRGETYTPLLTAIFNYNVDAVRVLLEYGANPNAGSGEGNAALEWAEFRNLDEIAQLLRDYGAS